MASSQESVSTSSRTKERKSESVLRCRGSRTSQTGLEGESASLLRGDRVLEPTPLAEVLFETGAEVPTIEFEDAQAEAELEKIDSEEALIGQTILKPELEAHLSATDPEAMEQVTSTKGRMLQYGIVFMNIFLGIYDSIFRSKASAGNKAGYISKHDSKYNREILGDSMYDINIVLLVNQICCIILGVALALKNRRFMALFTMDSLRQQITFITPAILFGLQSFFGFMAAAFMSMDTIKVLDQSRLVVTAVLTFLLLKRKLSRSTWNILIIISLSACMYMLSKQYSKDVATFKKQRDALIDVKFGRTVYNSKGYSSKGPEHPLNEDASEKTFKEWFGNWDGKDGNNAAIGMCCVFLACLAASFGNITAEGALKKYSDSPLYIQKIYLELPAIPMQLILALVVMPKLSKLSLLKDAFGAEKTVMDFESNAFWHGWNPSHNPYTMLMFLSFFIKCYFQGMCMKKLDSVVKQICILVATVAMFPFTTLHMCNYSYSPKDYPGQEGIEWLPKEIADAAEHPRVKWSEYQRVWGFWCFSDFKEASTMIVWTALVLVTFGSVAYLLSQRDKQRKVMYRKAAEDLSSKRESVEKVKRGSYV